MYEDQVMNVTDDNGEKFKENIYFYHMLVVFDLRGLMRDWVCLHNMRQMLVIAAYQNQILHKYKEYEKYEYISTILS